MLHHAKLFGCPTGEVYNAVMCKGPAVIDRHDNGAMGLGGLNKNFRSKRERAVRCGQSMMVKALSLRGSFRLKDAPPIPAC
ncbi:hypothetical protein AA15669_0766 [Saccharibacter floricola DSM 15669]|uniref:Transposase n=1 Tax=Saccharibacter floricola DSM 15669 TaxID=1123227 RepID=A0ABQ0NY21_9PROT|nr:hypothetical protein AA15669_0766 [Saccharibacter floricola DSM 15669]